MISKTYLQQNEQSKLHQSSVIQQQLQSDDEIIINIDNIPHEQIIDVIENEIYDENTYMIYDFLQISPDQILLDKIFNEDQICFNCRYLDQFKYFQKAQIQKNHKNESQYFFLNNGFFDCVKYLIQKGVKINRQSCFYAINHNDIEMLEYAREKGCEWDEQICNHAAKNNNLEMLKYAHEKGCPWDEYVCVNAAKNNNLEMLKYAHEKGCPYGNNQICCQATYHNNLEMLKYLHEIGCPWDHVVCYYAAKNNNLEILKYAHENGCPWNTNVFQEAIQNENFQIIRYLQENGCPHEGAIGTAACMGDIKMLKYLYENGCSFEMDEMICAIQWDNIQCLEFMHEKKKEYDQDICNEFYKCAIEHGSVDSLLFLYENKYQWTALQIEPIYKQQILQCLHDIDFFRNAHINITTTN